MEIILKFLLLIYFLVYFAVAFVLKSIVVAKRIGKNPLVLPKDDSAYGLIGRYFKLTLIALFAYVVLFAFLPNSNFIFLPISQLENSYIQYTGVVLLLFSLAWTMIAQKDMKDSWRIGIDHETKTALITSGLFRFSRNPIFFGMIISLLGLFLITPNALTSIFLILGYVLIQVQIRLEEEFLTKQHQQTYLLYKQKVRRFI